MFVQAKTKIRGSVNKKELSWSVWKILLSFPRKQMLLGHPKFLTNAIMAFVFKNIVVPQETFWRHEPTVSLAINKERICFPLA